MKLSLSETWAIPRNWMYSPLLIMTLVYSKLEQISVSALSSTRKMYTALLESKLESRLIVTERQIFRATNKVVHLLGLIASSVV